MFNAGGIGTQDESERVRERVSEMPIERWPLERQCRFFNVGDESSLSYLRTQPSNRSQLMSKHAVQRALAIRETDAPQSRETHASFCRTRISPIAVRGVYRDTAGQRPLAWSAPRRPTWTGHLLRVTELLPTVSCNFIAEQAVVCLLKLLHPGVTFVIRLVASQSCRLFPCDFGQVASISPTHYIRDLAVIP